MAYWVAQVLGGIAGAAILFGIFSSSPIYRIQIESRGSGPTATGRAPMILANAAGAFGAEVLLTAVFVFVILAVTRRAGNATVAGLVIGLCLTLVHIIGIPIDGTSVNPARSIGPALFVGGSALSQLWVFIFAPLIGGALSALVFQFLYPKGEEEEGPAPAVEERPSKTGGSRDERWPILGAWYCSRRALAERATRDPTGPQFTRVTSRRGARQGQRRARPSPAPIATKDGHQGSPERVISGS